MPSWKSRVPKSNTLPERQMRDILQELKNEGLIKTFIGSKWIQTPFRRQGIKQEADFLVDGILVIEVQGAKWHEKKRQQQKDVAKRESFEAMGYTVLWVWDDELKYANQVRRGPTWRRYVKDMVLIMLNHAYQTRKTFKTYQTWTRKANKLEIDHPELGKITIRTRRE